MNQNISRSYLSRTLPFVAILMVGIVVGLGGALVYIKKANDAHTATINTPAPVPAAQNMTPTVTVKKGDPQFLSGVVIAVKGNIITMQSQITRMSGDTTVDTKTVTLSGDAKLSKLTQKSPEEIRVESEAFTKVDTSSDNAVVQSRSLPDMFKREAVSLTDVHVKDNIVVTTVADISTEKEFLATALDIYANTTK